MGHGPLPITYYDVVMTHQWPRFRHAIRRDVGRLRALGEMGPIKTVDSFDSAMEDALMVDARGLATSFASRLGVDTATALSIIAQQQPALLESFVLAYNYAYHSVLNFELAGRKTFFFGDGLAERLLATEIASASDIVRLPFRTCQFVFTSPGVVQALEMIGGDSGKPLHLAYDVPVSVLATEMETPEYGGRSLILLVTQAAPSGTGKLLKRQLLLAPGRSLESALRTDWESIHRDVGIVEEHVGKRISDYGLEAAPVTDAPFFTDGLLIFRLVLNAILYLSSDRAELSDHPPRGGKVARTMNHAERRAAARQSALSYTSVGDSVQPIYVDGRDNQADDRGVAGHAGLYRLQHKLLVRGHWRHQAHGPLRAERKLIWVEPYMRGPDIAEAVNKPYVVR